jgi:NADH-quinone oxidoreductase subunit L
MVTAGVYLIGRNAVLFSHAPQVMMIVAVIGAATAIWAGAFGLVQNDIKRVLAYSTVSQLGYMMLAMGVGAFTAGIFHLFTHAFFKALLFLGSGAVIHALAGEQDLRRMGGLKRALPITYWTFLIGSLAIAGVPGLAGFFSKDEILARTFISGHLGLWVIGTLTSFLTAVYMFRLVFMAFHGERRDGGGHLHDAPPAMAIPLIILAAGSIMAGYIGVPAVLGGANRLEQFLAPSFQAETTGQVAIQQVALEGGVQENAALEGMLMAVASVIALAGIALAARFYLQRPAAASRLAGQFPGAYRFLLNKGYVDEVYNDAVVQPIRALSEGALWHGLDATVIDGAVNGTGVMVTETGMLVRKAQTGSVRSYAVSLLLGAVLVVGYYLWR